MQRENDGLRDGGGGNGIPDAPGITAKSYPVTKFTCGSRNPGSRDPHISRAGKTQRLQGKASSVSLCSSPDNTEWRQQGITWALTEA